MAITINEFKMWLEGVEEMQPENWSPDKRQWDRIREKINQLEATVQPAQPVQYAPSAPVYREEQIQYAPVSNAPVQYAPSTMPRVAPPPPNAALFGGDNPAFPVKTPNVDSSNGTYEAPFI